MTPEQKAKACVDFSRDEFETALKRLHPPAASHITRARGREAPVTYDDWKCTPPVDPACGCNRLLASVQRTLAESVRVQREAIARLATVDAQVARLLAENSRLRAQLAREELRARGVLA